MTTFAFPASITTTGAVSGWDQGFTKDSTSSQGEVRYLRQNNSYRIGFMPNSTTGVALFFVNNNATTGDPTYWTKNGQTVSDNTQVVGGDVISLFSSTGTSNGTFTVQHSWLGTTAGPTVTSITVANKIASTRQFTVTHTGTLTASDISYKINGVDITSLGSPNTPITNLQTTATGSTFDSYTLSSNGYHVINIGDQYLTFYKSSTTLAQTTFPELNNAGLSISFPSTAALWLAKAPGFDSVTLYNDGTQYKGTTQFNGYDRVEYLWIGTKYFNNTDPSLRGFKRYDISYIHETQTWLQGAVFYIDPVARYESTGLLTSSFSSSTQNFYSSYSFDFVSLTAQAPTTSNGGGRPDRYPLIMTNLFNRNRSLYSIGMTHKDTWDLFL